MLKFIIAFLILLAGSIAFAVFRKVRGGSFLPPRDSGDDSPRTLEEISEARKREKEERASGR